MQKIQLGNTQKHTWVSSGVTASPIYHELISGGEVVVSSAALSDSGNGHYYHFFAVNTTGYWVSKITATVDSKKYVKATKFKVVDLEVD